MSTTAVYFVASPLQYLAARQIARTHEAHSRQVLVWYKRGVGPVVDAAEWDASAYMPWPRWEPLPGAFGAHRRLLANLQEVAALVGRCDELHLHSAVYDTEAVNYFLRGLPRLCGARTMRARILPDGVLSVRRYPLGPTKRALQQLRHLRRLAAPELAYWSFAGDRIGSDAPFCDRIYVLPGLPHEYPADKVVTLAPLVAPAAAAHAGAPRALVVGQPLQGAGLADAAQRDRIGAAMQHWLQEQHIDAVDYKGHPKDPARELLQPGWRVLELDEPLESYMQHEPYSAVLGVRSSALLFARQIYGPEVRVLAFGWERLHFKSNAEQAAMTRAFDDLGVTLLPA
ncbi:polysialyltransferase family glycosyltransferase [Rubrivivax gelatinosus]|uniref:Capsular polysaccharide biosynthesis protein n=1 Tax=Rubrivivax gelatinosus TaxID=28068 RepID=A0ABS1DX70_RUBGE|nr:polysialyltransferase family glycosyltransferase [Rubrivivax gelatinosus]MBK1713944.1 hypothetical protein [Rubrivivax gelatinosus]